MSSISKPWPAVAPISTACDTLVLSDVPSTRARALPPSSLARSISILVHGSVIPNRQQPIASRMHCLSRLITGSGRSSQESAAANSASVRVALVSGASIAGLSDRDVRWCHKRRLGHIGWRRDLRRGQIGSKTKLAPRQNWLQDKIGSKTKLAPRQMLGLFDAIAM